MATGRKFRLEFEPRNSPKPSIYFFQRAVSVCFVATQVKSSKPLYNAKMFVELTGTRQENIEESVDLSKPF